MWRSNNWNEACEQVLAKGKKEKVLTNFSSKFVNRLIIVVTKVSHLNLPSIRCITLLLLLLSPQLFNYNCKWKL